MLLAKALLYKLSLLRVAVLLAALCVSPVKAAPNFKIFQIGFNKCGTSTLTDFFNANGIPSVHWDLGNLAYSMYINHFLHRPLLSPEYEQKYVGFFDMNYVLTPMPIEIGVMYFKELDKQYPGSKFILNTRRKDAWLLSKSNHHTFFNMTLLQRAAIQYGVSTPEMLDIWSELWDRHHAAVIEYFKDRPNDLLIFDIEQDDPQKIVDFFAPHFKLDPTLYGHKNNTVAKRGTGFAFVDKVYCINLLTSADRRAHMQQEFSRIGVTNYEFVEAVDKESREVKALLSSYQVKKFPPCFRCNKLFCKCPNNILIAPQVGNWLSFVKVFKDMIQNNVHYAIITEDDIKFSDDAVPILNTLISYPSFAANRIDLNQPFIIRLSGRYEPNNRDLKNIHLDKDPQLSNPCFMVNKKFAESFLKRLGIIDTTSDIFIHIKLPAKDKKIQAFAANPKPVYQLSSGEDESGVAAQFYSTIHPKGIDPLDKQRKDAHIKRIEYWDYLQERLGLSR